MTLSTRIGVMDRGQIVQIGVPREVYERPVSRFVAGFLGSVNLFHGVAHWQDGALSIETAEALNLPAGPDHAIAEGEPVHLAVRPEKLVVARESDAALPHALTGIVDDISYQGMLSILRIDLDIGQRVHALVTNVEREGAAPIVWGERVTVSWPPAAAMVLKS